MCALGREVPAGRTQPTSRRAPQQCTTPHLDKPQAWTMHQPKPGPAMHHHKPGRPSNTSSHAWTVCGRATISRSHKTLTPLNAKVCECAPYVWDSDMQKELTSEAISGRGRTHARTLVACRVARRHQACAVVLRRAPIQGPWTLASLCLQHNFLYHSVKARHSNLGLIVIQKRKKKSWMASMLR